MTMLCTLEAVYVLQFFSFGLVAAAFGFHMASLFNHLPGSRDLWDFIPFVSYLRVLANPDAHLTTKGYRYWKLTHIFYALMVLNILVVYYAFAPWCLAEIAAR